MAEKGQSLKDVLADFPPEELDKECVDWHLTCHVAPHITHWPSLGYRLKMTLPELENIKGTWPFDVGAQKRTLLIRWRDKRGHKATNRRLCRALWREGNVAAVKRLCRIAQGQDSASESASETSEDEDSDLSPPPTEKEQPGSSEVGEPTATGPVGSSPLLPYPTATPPPTSGNLPNTGSESRGSEPSTTLHPRQQPCPPPHPAPIQTPQPGGVVSLSGSKQMPHPLPSHQEGSLHKTCPLTCVTLPRPLPVKSTH